MCMDTYTAMCADMRWAMSRDLYIPKIDLATKTRPLRLIKTKMGMSRTAVDVMDCHDMWVDM